MSSIRIGCVLTWSSTREIATQVAKLRGRSETIILLTREVNIQGLLGGSGALNTHAAVLADIHKNRKVIPANAVDECPEGNDFLPSRISPKFLI